MRYFMITSESIGGEDRKIEVLHSTNDGEEAVEKLAYYSNSNELLIIEGKCRILMTTYEQ